MKTSQETKTRYARKASEPKWFAKAKCRGALTASATSGSSPFNEWYSFPNRHEALELIATTFDSQSFLDRFVWDDDQSEIYSIDDVTIDEAGSVTVNAGAKPADIDEMAHADSRF